ncbi:MAG: hypothetical protein WB729_09425, partial [Candidatus Sulfotelmatobacter sp.]
GVRSETGSAHAAIADGRWHSFSGERAGVRGVAGSTLARNNFNRGGWRGFGPRGFGGFGWRGGWGLGFGWGFGWGWGWDFWGPFWQWPAYWYSPWWGWNGYYGAPYADAYPY